MPLPKEDGNSPLNKTVMRAVWTNKVIMLGLGMKNEDEARSWFETNSWALTHFQTMNHELAEHITQLQHRALNGLREIRIQQIGSLPTAPTTLKIENRKKRKSDLNLNL